MRRKNLVPILAVLVIGAFLLVGRPDGLESSSFSPSTAAVLSNSSIGASAEITTTFVLNQPDSNTRILIFFVPSNFTVVTDGAIPDGATVGRLSATWSLGLINGACSTAVSIDFDLMDATTNTSNPVAYEAGFEDINGDGLFDAVTRYPDSLARIFPGLAPRARIFAARALAGTPHSINLVAFEPGDDILGLPIDSSLGYPVAFVLRNFGDPQAPSQPEPITDYCSSLEMTIRVAGITGDNPDTPANESGLTYRANPSDNGSYRFVAFSASQPDADNDGFENGMDTCLFIANAGNPHVFDDGDEDSDGLDVACDPNDNPLTGGANSDQDNDGYLNRHDNCPFTPNGELDASNQRDLDMDQIGDVCDPLPSTSNGHSHAECVFSAVNVGSGGPPIPAVPQEVMPCRPSGDNDIDGVSNEAEDSCGSDPLNAGARPERHDGSFENVDDDGDTQMDEALPSPASDAFDCDGDGWTGEQERLIYLDAPSTVRDQDPCGNNGWPADLDPNNILNIADIASFTTPNRTGDSIDAHGNFNYFNHALDDDGDTVIESAEDPGAPGGPTYNVARWNLQTPPHLATTQINIADIGELVNGSPSRPPMFGGKQAFFTNLGVCPWPP